MTGAEPPAQTHQIRASFGVGAEHLASEPTDANVPGEGARRPATLEQSQSRLPVQSFPVITPLGDEGRALISLTLRLPDALHNVLGGLAPDLVVAAGLEGWTVQSLANGDALLDRLAEQHGPISDDIREAVIEALDERAAVLRFSDPRPLRFADLKHLEEGLFGFAKDPRRAVAGALIPGACIILINVS